MATKKFYAMKRGGSSKAVIKRRSSKNRSSKQTGGSSNKNRNYKGKQYRVKQYRVQGRKSISRKMQRRRKYVKRVRSKYTKKGGKGGLLKRFSRSSTVKANNLANSQTVDESIHIDDSIHIEEAEKLLAILIDPDNSSHETDTGENLKIIYEQLKLFTKAVMMKMIKKKKIN